MKVKILLTITLLICFSFAHAQSFHLGLKAGANINKLSGMAFNEKFTFGYHAGGYAQIGIGKKFAIQPEVLFSEVSADTSENFSDILKPSLSKLSLKYLTIPVLLNYKASPILDIQAGPQYGILLDQNKTLVSNGKEAFKNGEFSLLAGLQFNLGAFKVYGRYAVGLNNISQIDNKDEWKNQTIQVGVALKLL